VLETLPMAHGSGPHYVIADDFGYAVSYCVRRLLEDLVSPAQRGSDQSQERWEQLRAAFAREDLTIAWDAARQAFSALLDDFVRDGYAPIQGDRLLDIANRYGLELELGDIFVLPRDAEALLARIGNPFTWWDDTMDRPEQEEQVFDFTNEAHRALLARRLREENEKA
jgi:hypothetical protein